MHRIHHKTLEVIYQPDTSFEDLLEFSNSVSIHQLRFLLTEIHKNTVNANPEFMWSFTEDREVPLILGGPSASHPTHQVNVF